MTQHSQTPLEIGGMLKQFNRPCLAEGIGMMATVNHDPSAQKTLHKVAEPIMRGGLIQPFDIVHQQVNALTMPTR